MELSTGVSDTTAEGQPVSIPQSQSKIWEQPNPHHAPVCHGPPLFPSMVSASGDLPNERYHCDENDNVNNGSEQAMVKDERSSCMFEGASQNNRTDVPENSLWQKRMSTEPSGNSLLNVAEDFIGNAISVKLGVSNGQRTPRKRVVSVKHTCNMDCCKGSDDHDDEQSPTPQTSVRLGLSMVGSGGSVIPRKHKCEECEYSTDNRSHLRRHITSVHCAVKQFSCYVCDKEFSRQEKVKIHIVRIHPEVEYEKSKIKKGDLITALEESDAKKIEESKNNSTTLRSPEKQSKNSGTSLRSPENPENQFDNLTGEATGDWQSSSIKGGRVNRHYRDLERKFRCTKCIYVGKDVWHLKRHMNEKHDGLKSFQCVDCNYSTSRKHRMITHMKTHGTLKCFFCSFTSTDLNVFHSHLTECTRLHRAATYPCAVCAQPFGVRKTYAKHMMDAHGLQLYLCDECLYVGLDYAEFSVHKASHETQGMGNIVEGSAMEGEHYCAPCNELFPNEDLLQRHVDDVHSGKVLPESPKEDDLLTCAVCDFRTSYRFVMRNHMRKHTGEKLSCDFPGCDFQATWRASIQHHKELKHAPPEKHVCSECDKVFHHKLNLKLHMKVHNKSYVCPVCGHAFAQLSHLNNHIAKHRAEGDIDINKEQLFKDAEVNENAFKCDVSGCLFRSIYRNVLKRHLDAVHGNKSPKARTTNKSAPKALDDQQAQVLAYSEKEKCPVCRKLFEERFQLRNHMFDKHNQVLQVEDEKEGNSGTE